MLANGIREKDIFILENLLDKNLWILVHQFRSHQYLSVFPEEKDCKCEHLLKVNCQPVGIY